MNGKITYHQQVSYCGKPRCRKCREGTGHGPYWYAYQTVDGRTTRTYVGKELPPEARVSSEGGREPSVHAVEREQSIIRIYVLGQFRLERRSTREGWQTVTDSSFQHQRVRSLLASLVSAPGRKLGREQIMEALWPDLEMEAASSRLDRAVYSLRQVFEPSRGRLATSPLLLTEREVLVLGEHPQIWIDADAFESCITQAHTTQDRGEEERLLDEAAMLYGGDFLPEEHKLEWTLSRRESLQRSWIGLLLRIADLRIERDAPNSAIEPLDRLLSIDPTNEAAVQRLISLMAQLGRRGEALRAYKQLATVLQREYRIAPLPETRALYEAVRSGVEKLPTRTTSPQEGSAQERPKSETPIIQIGRSHQSPLVGREHEIKMLHTLVTTTESAAKFKLAAQKRSSLTTLTTQRDPQCVLLLGDVGIGKTRLAEEVSRDAKKRGWAVAWSRVYAQEGSIPYRLWTEILRKAMAQGMWQRQEVSNRPLVFQPLTALLPEIQGLLPPINYPTALPPEQEQLRLWEAARELLALIAAGSPLLIALDDLQWADGSSCELLGYLARRLQGHPIVMVGTCRDHEMAATHPLRPLLTDLTRENAVATIQLQPLSDEQIHTLVASVPHVPEPLVPRIRKRANGNPFFAEELARSINLAIETRANGTGSRAGAELGLNGDITDYDHLQLPDTITAVLDLRLSRLTTECLRLMSKAAVLGGSFDFSTISAMEANVPGSDEDAVLELLEESLKSGMLTEEGTGTRITYHFWHPLLVSHLYERLSAARRASLHRRAAEVLRHAWANREEEGAADIVHHLVEGGSAPEQIARYAELAGNHAYALSSYPDAERHYRLALQYLAQIADRFPPPEPPPPGTLSEEQLHRARLLEFVGECARVQGKREDARRCYEEALELRSKRQVFASTEEKREEAQIRALLWCEVGVTWYDSGKIIQAREYYQRGEQVLKDAGIENGPAWAYTRFLQSFMSAREGNYDDARHAGLEALKLSEAIQEYQKPIVNSARLTRIERILTGDPINLGRAYMVLAAVAAADGHGKDALIHLHAALALFEQRDSQREIAMACCNLGDVHLRNAEYSRAQAFFRQSLNIAERIGEIPFVSFIMGNLGQLAARYGNLSESEQEFRRCILLAERSNEPVGLIMWGASFAVVLQEQDKPAEAVSALFRALATSRAMHIPPYIGMALVALGSIRITQAIAGSDIKDSSISSQEEAKRMLRRAKKTLQHAISLEGIEAETRTEGKLALAQALLLLNEIEEAYDLAEQTLAEARAYELAWLVARGQRVMGSILAARGQNTQADQQFEQALRSFRRTGMHLEYGQTAREYGKVLLQRDNGDEKARRKGLAYQQEAREEFVKCGAVLDLRMTEHALARYEEMSKV